MAQVISAIWTTGANRNNPKGDTIRRDGKWKTIAKPDKKSSAALCGARPLWRIMELPRDPRVRKRTANSMRIEMRNALKKGPILV
jgi:hypothetical protein